MDKVKHFLHENRFAIFLASQLAVLFGSLFFSDDLFERSIQPLLILFSIVAGINLISFNKTLTWFFIALFLGGAYFFGADVISGNVKSDWTSARMGVYLIFSIVITFNLIKQVWKAKRVTNNVILGLVSGYISLGFTAFFIFIIIELNYPGAFKGIILGTGSYYDKADSIMYYAFITLLTIGYGEIVPVIPISQKAAILTGLLGQFYLIIITTIVLEKYIRHSVKKDN